MMTEFYCFIGKWKMRPEKFWVKDEINFIAWIGNSSFLMKKTGKTKIILIKCQTSKKKGIL